jgi:branched-subunit amino acid transport protein
MDLSRVEIIVIMGLMAFAARAVPPMLFLGQKFPETWDRFLRYLSYALICAIIAITLFMSGTRFEARAAPYRAGSLIITIIVARTTKSALAGMLIGAALVSLLSSIR